MKQLFASIFSLFLPFWGMAQDSMISILPLENYMIKEQWGNRMRQKIQSDYSFSFASNVFTEYDILDLYSRNQLSDGRAQEIAAKPNDNANMIAFDLLNIRYQSERSGQLQWFTQLNRSNFFSLSGDKPLLNLLLLGNTPYKGNKLNFDENSIFSFQQYSAGIGVNYYQESGNYEIIYSIDANFISGISLNQFQLNSGSLYTEENAEYIDAVYDYSYLRTSSPGILRGTGYQFNGSVAMFLNQELSLSLGFSNLGSVNWQDNTIKTAAQDSIRIDGIGFDISDFEQASSTDNYNDEIDSIYQRIVPSASAVTNRVSLPLALDFRLSAAVQENGHFSLYLNFLPEYTPWPLVNFSYEHKLRKWIVGGNLGGGFIGQIGFGASLAYQSSKMRISLLGRNLVGIAPNEVPGSQVRIGASYFFN